MRKELGPINARIAAIVNEGTSVDRGVVRGLRRVEGEQRRDVVGERVARVVGGMQQQQRLALTVSVLGLSQCAVDSNDRSGNETVGDVEGEVRNYGGSVAADSGLVSPLASTLASPSSALPPLTPSPSPSPVPSPVSSNSPTRVTLSKLRKRVIESRNKLSLCGFHRRWWQRRMSGKHTPRDHILSSCSRRLQRINQRIRIITKKHQILRYDRIAEKYLHWENHLREQMMIRRWGTKMNVELDRERRADLAKLECLRKRRDALVRMISAKAQV